MGESLRAFCVQNNRQELLRQWDQAKNLAITPDSVSRGSKSKVWWRCQRGHVWQATVASRVAGCGCPVCAGRRVLPGENDLASRFPEVAAQWHPEKNGDLTPGDVTPYANRKVWWRCERGHDYQGWWRSAPCGVADVLTAWGRRCCRGSTTFPAGSRCWPSSGTRRRTAASCRRW